MKPSERIKEKLIENYGWSLQGNDLDQLEKMIATIIDYLDEEAAKSSKE